MRAPLTGKITGKNELLSLLCTTVTFQAGNWDWSQSTGQIKHCLFALFAPSNCGLYLLRPGNAKKHQFQGGRGSFYQPEPDPRNIFLQAWFIGQNWLKLTWMVEWELHRTDVDISKIPPWGK